MKKAFLLLIKLHIKERKPFSIENTGKVSDSKRVRISYIEELEKGEYFLFITRAMNNGVDRKINEFLNTEIA